MWGTTTCSPHFKVKRPGHETLRVPSCLWTQSHRPDSRCEAGADTASGWQTPARADILQLARVRCGQRPHRAQQHPGSAVRHTRSARPSPCRLLASPLPVCAAIISNLGLPRLNQQRPSAALEADQLAVQSAPTQKAGRPHLLIPPSSLLPWFASTTVAFPVSPAQTTGAE